eukprot:561079-Pleurochrysis_carterae.AAC.1
MTTILDVRDENSLICSVLDEALDSYHTCIDQKQKRMRSPRGCNCVNAKLFGKEASGARMQTKKHPLATWYPRYNTADRALKQSCTNLVLEVNRGHEHARSELVRRVERSAFLVQTPHQVEVAAGDAGKGDGGSDKGPSLGNDWLIRSTSASHLLSGTRLACVYLSAFGVDSLLLHAQRCGVRT